MTRADQPPTAPCTRARRALWLRFSVAIWLLALILSLMCLAMGRDETPLVMVVLIWPSLFCFALLFSIMGAFDRWRGAAPRWTVVLTLIVGTAAILQARPFWTWGVERLRFEHQRGWVTRAVAEINAGQIVTEGPIQRTPDHVYFQRVAGEAPSTVRFGAGPERSIIYTHKPKLPAASDIAATCVWLEDHYYQCSGPY